MKQQEFLDLFQEELFLPNIRHTTRDGALKEMVEHLSQQRKIRNPEVILETLKQRENLGSTGVGKGIAIPHARTLAVSKLIVVYGRASRGIDFQAMDGKPVHSVFLLIAPPQDPGNLYLQVLGKIAAVTLEAKPRKALKTATDFEKFKELLAEGVKG